jgi:hypothetical protein
MTIPRSSTPPTRRQSPSNSPALLLAAVAGMMLLAVVTGLGQAPGPVAAPAGDDVIARVSSTVPFVLPAGAAASEPVDGPIASNPDFYSEALVGGALARQEIRPQIELRGLVVPHHLLAARLIARGYGEAPDGVRTVFIVGPNHTNAGGANLATTSRSWATPLGAVAADDGLVRRAVREIGAADLPAVFSREHSIGAQMTFIRSRYPLADVVPFILDSYASRAQAEALGRWLALNSDGQTLAVFSIDFSHYLTEADADIRDAETRRAIMDGDLEKISRFGNDNVDSPASLIAALSFARAANLRVEVADNTNANDFLPAPEASTTSHFLIELKE